jgi:hypothetical protein
MGFPIPWNTWFREGLYQPVRDLIENQSFRERGIYDIPHIRRSLALHREGKKDYAPELFKIIQYELWQQIQKDQYATNA